MLTRIEIDGFKTFADFKLNLNPFTAVLGSNAAGKSNFFDAIQFIRRLTEESLSTAVQEARGELDDLFRRRGDGSLCNIMRFAVEVLLEPTVRDPWGTQVELTQSRVRYELHIARREDQDGNVRLYVQHEAAVPLRRSTGGLAERWSMHPSFLERYMRDGRRASSFLETKTDPKRGSIFQIRQDGVQGRARPAESAEATVLSSMNSAEFKHLYALREEIASWRFLQLEPQALRQPGERFGDERLLPDGSNLARVLYRIQRETTSDAVPAGLVAAISSDLASLIPGIRRVEVRENPQTRKYEIHVQTRDGVAFRADVASDGTLRVLALLVALYDPRYRGLICFEEPENGVHPFRLRLLVKYLRQLVSDPTVPPELSAPLAQVVINSHSPVVLSAVDPSDCVFFDTVTLIERNEDNHTRISSQVSRVRQIVEDASQRVLIEVPSLTRLEIDRYRAAAQLDQSEELVDA